MRHSNGKRPRGRSGRRGGNSGPNANRAYDSNGPSGKLRGTASQLVEKYTAAARDARAGRDRVLVENYLQHAEHYQRVLNELQAQQAAQQAAREEQPDVSNNKGEQPTQPAVEGAEPEAAAANGGGAVNGKPTQDEQPVIEAADVAAEEPVVEAKPKRRRRPAAAEAPAEKPDGGEETPAADA